jgi:hypothetical protein
LYTEEDGSRLGGVEDHEMGNRWDVAAAAGELLDRLDDLYDQKPEALAALVEALGRHLAVVSPSDFGRLAWAAHSQLVDLDPSRMGAYELNRQALAVTGDLRLRCSDVWSDGAAHEAVEHNRVGVLQGGC